MEIKQVGTINILSADEGMYIHRIDSEIYGSKITMLPSDTLDMFEEVRELPKFTKSEYENKVKELIKEKYSVEEELAIQRKAFNTLLSPMTLSEDKAESVMDEYNEYNLFVEDCKVRAVEILNTKEDSETYTD